MKRPTARLGKLATVKLPTATLRSGGPPTGRRPVGGDRATTRRPFYPRLLRLRHVHPNGWQRAVLGEGALAVAILLVLADLASAWTLLVLPLAVAALVKAHDALAGLLADPGPRTGNADGAGPRGEPAPSSTD